MTRKEWMLKNHPDVVDDTFNGGVLGCPGIYQDLIDIDPSAIALDYLMCDYSIYSTCTVCWNQEIPEKKEKATEEPELSVKEAIDQAVCDCDTCSHQDLCRFEDQFRGVTKEMYQHCIEETERYNLGNPGIQILPLHCKRYAESQNIKELNCAVFHLKAQQLTDELVRKIFDEEPKESK